MRGLCRGDAACEGWVGLGDDVIGERWEAGGLNAPESLSRGFADPWVAVARTGEHKLGEGGHEALESGRLGLSSHDQVLDERSAQIRVFGLSGRLDCLFDDGAEAAAGDDDRGGGVVRHVAEELGRLAEEYASQGSEEVEPSLEA
jgi:hypothetical protein